MGPEEKTERFMANEKLNALLGEMKILLEPVQAEVNGRFQHPKFPVGLILGPPRCGSTVFLQFMAGTGSFSYPSNILTRFAYAPYIGAMVEKMLLNPDYDFLDEFSDLQGRISFESDLGKSKGALATNEFFHFWRSYLNRYFPEPFSDEELMKIDFKSLSAALASIEDAYGKPFCAKGMLHQFNLDVFFENQPWYFFFRIMRDPIYIAQSLLLSREAYYGDRTVWWSAKPKEYEQLQNMDVYYQVAGQVYYTEKAIEGGLCNVPASHQLSIDYESFCVNPEAVYGKVKEKYAKLNCILPPIYKGPNTLVCGNTQRLSNKEFAKLEEAYADFNAGAVSVDA